MFCGLAAANAGVGEMFFLKGNAARFHAACHVLELVLAFDISTPHSLDISGLIGGGVDEFVVCEGNVKL